MTDRHALQQQLVAHEGLCLKPYRCTAGKLTIGVGRNIQDVGITEAEALYLLNQDIEACEADLATYPWFSGLDPVRQRVLVDMRFNLGPTRFRQFTQTLAAVAAGRYADAADRMLQSKWAGQVGARAERLARWMRTGVATW